MAKASSMKDMQTVAAVKFIKIRPCKAIAGKKVTMIQTEETFAKRPVLRAWPACDFPFFPSSLGKLAEKLQS